MADKDKTETTTDVEELVDAPKDAREDAQERARLCAQEVGMILDKYKCRILPRIDPEAIEPVGLTGNKIQIEASYWIAPLA